MRVEPEMFALGVVDGAVIFWHDTMEDPPAGPPGFLVAGRITDAVRDAMRRHLRRGYEVSVPGRAARIASDEAVRLMEADAHREQEAGVPITVLFHTLSVCNLAWMKAGISPEIGDAIANSRRTPPDSALPNADPPEEG